MSSRSVVLTLNEVGKCYQTYSKPQDRLKQFFLPKLSRALGTPVRQYSRDFWALRHVSLEIERGEAVGIIGKNGSGKSTLLQIVTGVLAPTEGQVETRGRIAALLELGSGFNPEFTGRENVFLNGALLGFTQSEIEARFDSIAGFADIGDFIDQPVKTYSSGMFVRLAFAVQVQLDPDILIVDEALAVGDALFQKRCYQRIERFLNNGGSLLFVSHDQEAIRTITNRALLLAAGQPRAYGTSAEVVREYRRLLHDEETRLLTAMTEGLRTPVQTRQEEPTLSDERFSFGDLEAEILSVETTDSSGAAKSHFTIGEPLRLAIRCRANIALAHCSIAFRLRNREGVKITSWGTLNEDMQKLSDDPASDNVFWRRTFAEGEIFEVSFSGTCSLSANFYEVQATITYEGDPYYGQQRILHWRDEAAFFSVGLRHKEYVVGGICDLGLRSNFARLDS
jgi:lipopolysaccharide transport system ATP-binding protein